MGRQDTGPLGVQQRNQRPGVPAAGLTEHNELVGWSPLDRQLHLRHVSWRQTHLLVQSDRLSCMNQLDLCADIMKCWHAGLCCQIESRNLTNHEIDKRFLCHK